MIGELLGFVLLGFIGTGLFGLVLSRLPKSTKGGAQSVFGRPKHGGPRLAGGVAIAASVFGVNGLFCFLASMDRPYGGIGAGVCFATCLSLWFFSGRRFSVSNTHFAYVGNTSYSLTCLNDALWDAEAEVLFFRSGRYPESPERDVALPLTPAAWEMLREKMAEQKVVTA